MKNALKTGVLTLIILLIMSSAAMAKENSNGNDIQIKINFFMEWGAISQYSLEFENKEKPRLIQK